MTFKGHPGWVPNQHGAWAMVISPLIVGIIAGGPRWIHLPLTAFWLLGYFAFFAVSLWLKARRRAKWFPPVRAYALAATAMGLVVLAMDPTLIQWAPAFVLPLGIGLWAASRRRDRDLVVGVTTIIGASAMTLVAYDAGHHGVDQRAWQLAGVQLLYFTGTVFYVKSAIRERDNLAFLWTSVAFHAGACAITWVLNVWLGLVFAVLLARSAVLPPLRLTPKTLGILEILATLAVALVSLVVL